jgi:hypothetical protein
MAIAVLCWAGLALLSGETLFAQLPTPPGSREYRVDSGNPNSSGANPGTAASPFKTIRKAAEAAEAGDVVLVQPGSVNQFAILEPNYIKVKLDQVEEYEVQAQFFGSITVNPSNWAKCFLLNVATLLPRSSAVAATMTS